MEIEARCVVLSIRRLRRDVVGVFFNVYTNLEDLQQIFTTVNLNHTMKAGYNFSRYVISALYAVKAKTTTKIRVISSPLPPSTEADIIGSSALIAPDDLGIGQIIFCGNITSFRNIQGLGLNMLDAVPNTSILGGLYYMETYFRDHHNPLPTPLTRGPTETLHRPSSPFSYDH